MNRAYVFEVKLFTKEHLFCRVQGILVVMKIDPKFNTKGDCEHVPRCDTSLVHAHLMLARKNWQKIYELNLKITGEPVPTGWYYSIAKCYYLSIEFRAGIRKLSEEKMLRYKSRTAL